MPKACSRWPDPTVVDQRNASTGSTDSEVFIVDTVDEDCDSSVSTVRTLRMQRDSEDPEKELGGVVPFTERSPDNIASTLEWKGRVLHQHEAAQNTTSSSRQQRTAKERWQASME